MFWLLTVLRTAPYKKDTEDVASFLSLLGLTVTIGEQASLSNIEEHYQEVPEDLPPR